MVTKSAKKKILTNKQAQTQHKKKLKLVSQIRELQLDLANINIQLADSGALYVVQPDCW